MIRYVEPPDRSFSALLHGLRRNDNDTFVKPRFWGSNPGGVGAYIKLRGGTMFICDACGKSEPQCKCDRFCMLCQVDFQVRLCKDGYYYCKDCRDACDFRWED